jgi:gliding motility-associated-like protein
MENKFDELIKKAALEHEEEYRHEFWEAFENKLNARQRASKNWLKYAAGTLLIVSSVAAWIYFNSNKAEKNISANKSLPADIVPADKLNKNNIIVDETKSETVHLQENKEEKVLEKNKTEIANNNVVQIENKQELVKEEKELSATTTEIQTSSNSENKVSSSKLLIELKKKIVCEGEQFTVNALNVPENTVLSWDFGDGKSSNKKQASHAYSKAGNYEIVLNCFEDKKLVQKERVQITVVSNPKANFEWTDKLLEELSENYTIAFSDQSFDAVKWMWNFGDNKTSSIANPIHTYNRQGTYAITLEVTNMNGCKDQKTQFVNVIDQNPLLAPNSFSPNGDGLNDYFMPKALENGNFNFELKILDRNGNVVYQTNDSNKPWNGRVNNTGELFNNGTPFIWIVTINSEDGNVKRFTGTINIVN